MKRFLIASACTLVLAGCSGSGSGANNKYVGHWSSVKVAHDTLSITQSGDSLMVKVTHPGDRGGGMQTDRFAGVVKDGVLQVQTIRHIASFAIDKVTGHMVGSGDEYKRIE